MINALNESLRIVSVRLLSKKELYIFMFSGTLLTFAGSIYSSAIGFTEKIAADPKPYVGLAGVMFGVGEVAGKFYSCIKILTTEE